MTQNGRDGYSCFAQRNGFFICMGHAFVHRVAVFIPKMVGMAILVLPNKTDFLCGWAMH